MDGLVHNIKSFSQTINAILTLSLTHSHTHADILVLRGRRVDLCGIVSHVQACGLFRIGLLNQPRFPCTEANVNDV